MPNAPPQFAEWREAVFDVPSSSFAYDPDNRLCDFSVFTINLEEYTKLRFLGSGGYADVTLYKHRFTFEHVAVKVLRPGLADTDRLRTLFMREVIILRELVHPCICRLRGVVIPTDVNPGLIATEFVAGGSLRAVLGDPPRWFTPTAKVIVLAGIVVAMIYVHAKGIMHRDLKPGNVLLDDRGRPKLCDFGTGKFNDGSPNTANFGTVLYMAPEMYDEEAVYCGKVDVYAFAMILYEVIVGMPAFEKPTRGTFWAHVMHIKRGGRRTIPPAVKNRTGRLIEACWGQVPEERPSFAEVFEAMAAMNFALLDGVQVDEVYRFFEWTAGRPM
jgi:serine/threonine protein kinase